MYTCVTKHRYTMSTQTYANNSMSEGGSLIFQNKVVSIIKQEVIQPVAGVDESHQKEAVT